MPISGKRLLLPMRVTPRADELPDVDLTLPEITLPGDFIAVPPTVPAPPSPEFRIHDIIGMLPREPQNAIGIDTKTSLTFHWEGGSAIPPMSVDGHVIFLQAIARFHIRKNWAASGVVNGDGIMYHEAIGQNGDTFLMRDYGDILYHAGNDVGNRQSRAILVVCSQQTPPTMAQLQAVKKRITDFRANAGTRIPAYPHHRWSPTACPGPDITRTLEGEG